ncbi:unnamed protein product [Ectocarpus fasciculatus]
MACSAWWWAFCEVSSTRRGRSGVLLVEPNTAVCFAPGGGHCNISMVKMVAGKLAQIQVCQD